MATLTPDTTALQYLRNCYLLVSNSVGGTLDLSNLRIKFAVKRSDTQTPNVADIRVYNLMPETAAFIKKEFTTVILQAGYAGNYGVIFKGNIKQVILGRESATDTFIDIIAGDGDKAYNFAIVNTTLAKGSSQSDHLKAALDPMAPHGVTPGVVGDLPVTKLPRGKVMYGDSKKYIKGIADSTGFGWSIQEEKVNFIKQSTYLPGTIVTLTSKTGMIGTPQQTNQGVNVKCLLNPYIRIGGRVKIDEASIEALKINLSVVGSPANTALPLTADGVYYVLCAEHQGDTRELEWYTSIIALYIDETTVFIDSVGSVSG